MSVTVPVPVPSSVTIRIGANVTPDRPEGGPSKANHVLPPFGIGVMKLTVPVVREP